MNIVRITPTNVFEYVGYEIVFKTRNEHIVKTIIRVSKTGKSITINHPDLHNSLNITSRKVYVIVEN
jgi:hypothetical protein